MFWGSVVQFLACARYPSFLKIIQNMFGTHPASYSLGNMGSVPRDKAASPRWGWVVTVTPQSFYPQERDPGSILQEAGWASGMVCMGVENLTITGVWTTDYWSTWRVAILTEQSQLSPLQNTNSNSKWIIYCRILYWQHCCRCVKSAGMWCCVIGCVVTGVLKDPSIQIVGNPSPSDTASHPRSWICRSYISFRLSSFELGCVLVQIIECIVHQQYQLNC